MSVKKNGFLVIVLLAAVLALGRAAAWGGDPIGASNGQAVYLPVYSQVYYGDKERRINLTVTVSIRNTDRKTPILLTSVRYYDEHGEMVNEYLTGPMKIGPLAAARFLVAESDLKGGAAACFIVKWESPRPAAEPVVQAVMIGAEANQGISFLTNGRVLDEAED